MASPLRRPDALPEVTRQGLFRCTEASQVLAGFGIIFKEGLYGLLAAGKCSAQFPTIEQVQGAGAYLYNNSHETDHVEVFISHSWSAGRWVKFLALCLFFNLPLAIQSSIASWFLMVTGLTATYGVTGVGGKALAFPCLVCIPVATFFLFFIFGHDLFRNRQSLWVDRLCVHQTNLELKQAQIAALPVFVANSSRMLMIWDETYFDRLWCNLELATFAQKRGIEKVDVVPVWLAPWLLCSVFLDFLSVSMLELLEHVFPSFTAAWGNGFIEAIQGILGSNPATSKFVATFVLWMIAGIAYLPVSIPSFFSFQMKLRNHQLLLDQMASFDVRAAKCALPPDREAIMDQVDALFQRRHGGAADKGDLTVDDGEVQLQRFVLEAVEAEAKDEGCSAERFNAHVRGPLCSQVISQIGSAVNVSWQMSFTSFLPMIFYASVNTLACDNADCETAAAVSGFSSVAQYMGAQMLAWALVITLVLPLTCPLLLRMINAVLYGTTSHGACQVLMALLCCPLSYIYTLICGGFVWGSVFCLVEYFSSVQLLIFLVVLFILMLQGFWLFSQSAVGHGSQNQGGSASGSTSCRCVTRTGATEVMPLFSSE